MKAVKCLIYLTGSHTICVVQYERAYLVQCPNEVAEAVLGHTRGGVEGIYNLYKYDAECRKWLQVWADYLERIVKIQLKKAPYEYWNAIRRMC